MKLRNCGLITEFGLEERRELVLCQLPMPSVVDAVLFQPLLGLLDDIYQWVTQFGDRTDGAKFAPDGTRCVLGEIGASQDPKRFVPRTVTYVNIVSSLRGPCFVDPVCLGMFERASLTMRTARLNSRTLKPAVSMLGCSCWREGNVN